MEVATVVIFSPVAEKRKVRQKSPTSECLEVVELAWELKLNSLEGQTSSRMRQAAETRRGPRAGFCLLMR